MDFKNWVSVIKDWANALALVENEIKDIKELASTGFFSKLIGYLQAENIKIVQKSGEDFENLAQFINVIYPHYNLKNENEWDDKELIIISTLLLINSSLHTSNIDIKTRLCSLPNTTQRILLDFLQEFVEYQPNLISREMIVDAITQGSNTSQNQKTPKKMSNWSYSNSPKSNSESPFFRQVKELYMKDKEIKRLNFKLDLITSEKADLESDLITAKDSIDELREDIKKKEREIKKLQGEGNNRVPSPRLTHRRPSEEDKFKDLQRKYQDDIDAYEINICSLHEEIRKLQKDKRELYNKISGSEKNVLSLSQKAEMLQGENSDLMNKNISLQKCIEELSITCKEQADIISETKNNQYMTTINDSDTSTINCESLASQVIDLQLKELEENFKAKCCEVTEKQQLLDDMETKVENMLQTIETLNRKIVCLQSEINENVAVRESAKETCKEMMTQLQISCHDFPEHATLTSNELVEMIGCIKESLLNLKQSQDKKASDIEKKQLEISELNLKCNDYTTMLARMEKHAHSTETYNSTLEEDLKSKNELISSLNISIKNYQDELILCKGLNEKYLNDNKLIVDNKLDEIVNLETSIELLKKDNDEKNNIIKKLQEVNSKSEEIIMEAKNRIQQLEQSCMLETRISDNCSKKLKDLESENEKLKKNIEAKTITLSSLENKIVGLEKESENDKVTIKKLKAAIREANFLSTARNNDKIKLQNTIKTLTSAKDKLETEMFTMKETLNSKIDYAKRIEDQMANLNSDIIKFQLENNEMKTQILMSKNEYERLTTALLLKTNEIEELKRENPNNDNTIKELERKFLKLKAVMKQKYNEHLANVVEEHETKISSYKDKAIQEMREKEHSIKILQAENEGLKKEINKLKLELKMKYNTFNDDIKRVQEPLLVNSTLNKSRSLEHIGCSGLFGEDSVIQPVEITFCLENHVNTRRRNVPSGLEEEAGEVFDDRHLADLQEGVCHLPQQLDRLSILQHRNSMCPPHLKSSYPLETQFCDPKEYLEDMIRGREKSDLQKTQRHSTLPVNNGTRTMRKSEVASHDRLRGLFKGRPKE